MTVPHRTAVRRYAGYLYALHFANGLVKVGRTSDPPTRIGDHIREGQSHGNPVRLQWLSVFIVHLQKAERELIDWCRAQPGAVQVRGHEWFMGLDYEDVVEQVKRVCRTRAVSEVSGRLLTNVASYGAMTDVSQLVEPEPVIVEPYPLPAPDPPPPPRPRLDRSAPLGAYARPHPERSAPDGLDAADAARQARRAAWRPVST